ncbi:MAG: ATP-grasp domain-containing protein [Candidatus Thorarchaeota archaeon]
MSIALTMPLEESLLKGKTVAVIGFNARPLACSAKRAGAEVIVSDYWGDEDLAECSSRWKAVLAPQRGQRQRRPLEEPPHEILVRNLLESIQGRQVNFLFVGSGFDDNTSSLRLLESEVPIAGNSSGLMSTSRNFETLSSYADELNLGFPTRLTAKSVAEALDLCEEIGYPCVIRPPRSGGGRGITLVSNPVQAESASWKLEFDETVEEIVVQEYIQGIDASCSVLSTGDDAKAVSVQGQLIGIPSAGRNNDFVYSGNYIPLEVNGVAKTRMELASESICESFKLVGSNGIDFVVDKNGYVWLMEVNPRFQGTLEMLEHSGNVSMTELHTSACLGSLPSQWPSYVPAVRLVVFARRTGLIPDLSKYPSAVDRTPEGVLMKRGDPVCSLVLKRESLQSCYLEAMSAATSIQNGITPI